MVKRDNSWCQFTIPLGSESTIFNLISRLFLCQHALEMLKKGLGPFLQIDEPMEEARPLGSAGECGIPGVPTCSCTVFTVHGSCPDQPRSPCPASPAPTA